MIDLNTASRKNLESYMIDCHGFDEDELAEWDRDDLVADIRSFGWEKECQEYLA
jgi:hypothetical protein